MYINEIVGAFRLAICGYIHQEVLSLTCMWHTACIRYGLILIGTGNTVVTEVAAAAALNYLVYKQTGPITRDNDVVDTLWQVLMYSDYWKQQILPNYIPYVSYHWSWHWLHKVMRTVLDLATTKVTYVPYCACRGWPKESDCPIWSVSRLTLGNCQPHMVRVAAKQRNLSTQYGPLSTYASKEGRTIWCGPHLTPENG